MNIKAKSNLDKIITNKNYDNISKNNPITNIKELF